MRVHYHGMAGPYPADAGVRNVAFRSEIGRKADMLQTHQKRRE
jgi:hypothetical protein